MQLKLDPDEEKSLILWESEIKKWETEAHKMIETDVEEGRRMARGVRTRARVQEDLKRKRDALLAANRYYLKAMNCPHHHKLFAAVPRSYRDLPLRLAEYGTCYRYEQSGELFGLMRVRSMQMNDAHIYCTPEQFEAEFNAVNQMYLKYFKLFGIEKYLM